jgi:uncharacterized protein YdiU (UPF0061 family)
MACFANSLLPLIDEDSEKAVTQAQDVINDFPKNMNEAVMGVMCKKIGLESSEKDSQELVKSFLNIMLDNKSDYTLSFRYLSESLKGKEDRLKAQFQENDRLCGWLLKWTKTLENKNLNKKDVINLMDKTNPFFIPRNHFLERIIDAATENNDFSEMKTLLKVLSTPYKEQPKNEAYLKPPKPDEIVKQTFCGT